MHDRGVQKNEYFPVSYYEWKIDGTKMSRSVYRRNPNENRSPVLIEQHGPSSISSSSGNWKFIREKLVKNEDDWSIAETGSSAFKSLRNSLMLNACPELMAQNGGANPKSSKVQQRSSYPNLAGYHCIAVTLWASRTNEGTIRCHRMCAFSSSQRSANWGSLMIRIHGWNQFMFSIMLQPIELGILLDGSWNDDDHLCFQSMHQFLTFISCKYFLERR